MTDHYPDPESEAASRAAQVAAMTMAIVEALSRLRDDHLAQRLQDDQRATISARAARFADHAAASVTWAPALERSWLAQADTHALLDAWAPAVAWAPTDTEAEKARQAIETRLTTTQPDGMSTYQAALGEGRSPADAMRDAATAFTSRPAETTSRRQSESTHRVHAVRTTAQRPVRRR